MSVETPRHTLRFFLPLLALLLGFGGFYGVYALANGLTWQFDDYINLKDLAGASSPTGVINFVFGGIAGPLGRPLSLATFLANYNDWPNNPWGMVQLSLLIHAINGALVFLLARRVFLTFPTSDALRTAWLALSVALLWLFLPIHASGLLMPVQRMTHVSAFFVLIALYGYMVFRQRQNGKTPTAPEILGLSLWLTLTGLAAAFSKENGVTAATFIFLLEIFCFYPNWKSHPASGMGVIWRIWIVLCGCIVSLAMAWQIINSWNIFKDTFEYYRGYHWNEHIATQWTISLEYVRQIILPRSALLGPFHDNHAVYGWDVAKPYFAILFWIILIATALRLTLRSTSPSHKTLGWTSFAAILWFFAGHQVESSVIPLELYFEHRNYLACLGICFLLIATFDHFINQAKNKIVPYSIVILYIFYLLFSLQQTTSLWGQPLLAHDLWFKNQPQSTRAAQAAIADLMEYNFEDAAFVLADDFIKKQNAVDVAIQMMPLRCKKHSAAQQAHAFGELLNMIDHLKAPGGVATGLALFGNAVREEKCQGVSTANYEFFLRKLLSRPQIQKSPRIRHHVFYEIALTNKHHGDTKGYIHNMQNAYWDFPSISVAQIIAAALFQEEQIEEAIAWIDTVIINAPNRSLKIAWRDTLQSMRDALMQIKQNLQGIPTN